MNKIPCKISREKIAGKNNEGNSDFYFLYCSLTKKNIMKTAGWILILIGIVMILIKGFSVPVEKKVVDLGPVEINRTENKWIGWPTYAGGILAVIGVVLVVADRKK